MRQDNDTFFGRVFPREKPIVIGGYSVPSVTHLLAWMGLGCLGAVLFSITLFVLILALSFKLAGWLQPMGAQLEEQAGQAKEWMDTRLQQTQQKVDSLQLKVNELTTEIERIKQK